MINLYMVILLKIMRVNLPLMLATIMKEEEIRARGTSNLYELGLPHLASISYYVFY